MQQRLGVGTVLIFCQVALTQYGILSRLLIGSSVSGKAEWCDSSVGGHYGRHWEIQVGCLSSYWCGLYGNIYRQILGQTYKEFSIPPLL